MVNCTCNLFDIETTIGLGKTLTIDCVVHNFNAL